MTPSDNTNPVVKESLTTQKEDIEQGQIFDVLCEDCDERKKLQSENDQLKKVIDQCEEALELSLKESLFLAQVEDNFQSACEPFVKEALSTIQSLKLKGK